MGRDARKLVFGVCERKRSRSACTFAQTDQLPFYLLFGKYHIETCFKRNFNILASLCSQGDWFESRFVRNPKDRFCHVQGPNVNRDVLPTDYSTNK